MYVYGLHPKVYIMLNVYCNLLGITIKSHNSKILNDLSTSLFPNSYDLETFKKRAYTYLKGKQRAGYPSGVVDAHGWRWTLTIRGPLRLFALLSYKKYTSIKHSPGMAVVANYYSRWKEGSKFRAVTSVSQRSTLHIMFASCNLGGERQYK